MKSDLEILTDLNRNYVRSVEERDDPVVADGAGDPRQTPLTDDSRKS